MNKRLWHARWIRAILVLGGGAFILGGCDPTIQATVENGIITTTNSLLASLLQAALQVATEPAP
jgi:hypothetical protein